MSWFRGAGPAKRRSIRFALTLSVAEGFCFFFYQEKKKKKRCLFTNGCIKNNYSLLFLVLFCFSKKEPNPSTSLRRSPKSPPDRTGRDYIPPDSYRDREGSLIWLLYYCGLYIGNSTLRCSQPNLTKNSFLLKGYPHLIFIEATATMVFFDFDVT